MSDLRVWSLIHLECTVLVGFKKKKKNPDLPTLISKTMQSETHIYFFFGLMIFSLYIQFFFGNVQGCHFKRLPMLIIGYNHIFIGCFQVEHGYLIVFFKRTLQPIAVEIRFTVVSCHDLWYFSGFNPVLEENIQIRKHDWIMKRERQITDFFAFKSKRLKGLLFFLSSWGI